MRSRWIVAGAGVLLLAVAVAAADVFQQYGLDRQAWADSFVNSMTTRSLYAPSLPAKLKAIAPAERAAAVNALGAAAKAFFATPEFKAQYQKEYEASLPDDLKPPRTAKQIADQTRADMEKSVKEMEASLKDLPPDMRKQMEPALAAARTQMQEELKNLDQLAAMQAAEEKQRYEEAKSRPPDPDALSADPKVSLRKSLQMFLDESAGVDFAAQLKTEFGLKRFVKPDYESKPKPWKMCFRAGREACDAARAFATAWLAEVK